MLVFKLVSPPQIVVEIFSCNTSEVTVYPHLDSVIISIYMLYMIAFVVTVSFLIADKNMIKYVLWCKTEYMIAAHQ